MRLSDAEYLLREEIKEKKAAGRGAFHRKCGAKSKKCTLPHERLSKKELEQMNGEVESYNPKAWYTYEEFKKLPMKFQVEYVNSLITRYNCSCAGICQYVFGICRTALSNHFRKAGQLEFINNRDAHWRTTTAGDQKLKEDVEAARAIQNGSNVINDIEEAKEDEPYESPQKQIQKAIDEAVKTVDLYLSRGMQLTPELINQIYEEKTGMSFAEAMKYIDEGVIGRVDKIQESESGIRVEATLTEEGKKFVDMLSEDPKPMQSVVPEDSTDVKSFSIVMDHIDMSIIQYVSDLFKGKKIVVSFEVKEVKE